MAFRFTSPHRNYRIGMTIVLMMISGVEAILVSYLVRRILLALLLLLAILLLLLRLWLYDS